MPQLKKITLNKCSKNKSKTKTQTEVELPSKFELIAEIDRNLKHLQGQRKILQMSKHCKTWANNFTANQPENRKILNSMSKQTEKCDCKEVCEVLQEVSKKNCVIKITDSSSTQFETHLCPEPRRRQCYREPIRVVEESESEQRNSLHSKSENRKSRTPTRKGLHTEITQTKLRPSSDRERKICRHLNKSKTGSQMAHSNEFDLRCNKGLYRTCACVNVVDEGLENNATRLRRNKERKSLNLPDFFTEQKTLRSTSHSRPTETSYKGSVINRTPSSVKRHAKLSEDIIDFARLPKDQRKSRSHSERGHNNYTRLTRKESIISYTEKESTLRNPNKLEQSQNIQKTLRISEKRTKIKEVRIQHSRRQTIPEKLRDSFKASSKEHVHYASDKIVTSKFLKEEDLQDNGKLNTTNHTLGSNSLNSNREYIRKQNVIDDNTYICPHNSEENDYLILPYTNMSQQTALTPSPQCISQKLSNVGLLNKENEVTERYSGVCSKCFSNYEHRGNSSEASVLQKHSVEPIFSKPEFSMKIPNQFKAHDENENFSKFVSKEKNEEKFLSQSTPLDHTDFSDYVSHKLESTWESHIHRPNPKSKLVTSRDSHLRASSRLPSHRHRIEEKLTEIGQKGAFQTSEPSGPTNFETTYRSFDHKLNALSKNSSNISAEKKNITELSRGFEYPSNAISVQVQTHTSETGKQKMGSYERQMVSHSVQTEVLPLYHERTSLSTTSERWKPGDFWLHRNYMVEGKHNEDSLQRAEANKNNTNFMSKRDQELDAMLAPKIQDQSLSTHESEQLESKDFLNPIQEFEHMSIPPESKEEFSTSRMRSMSNESLIKQEYDTPLLPSSSQSKPMRTEQVKSQPMLISQDNSSIRSPNGSKFCVNSTTQHKMSSSHKSKPKIEDVVNDTLPLSEDLHLRSEHKEKFSGRTEKSKPKSMQKKILSPRAEGSALGAISKSNNLFRNDSLDNQFEVKHQSRMFSVEKDYKIPQQRKADVDKGGTKSCNLKTKSAESSLNALKTKAKDKEIGHSLSFLALEKRTLQDISATKEWSEQNFSGFPSSKSLNLNPHLLEVQKQNLRKGENDSSIQLQSHNNKNKSTSGSVDQASGSVNQTSGSVDLQLKSNVMKKNATVTTSEGFIKSNSDTSKTSENKKQIIRDKGSSQSIPETGRNCNINRTTEECNLSGKAAVEEKTQYPNAIGYMKLDSKPSTSANAMRALDQTRNLTKDDFEWSELELEVCCCNEECCGELTTDSSEIPTFEGCECMRADYYKIMQIAYNK